MKTIKDICYSDEHKQYLDVYLPERDSFPVFLYFHGGGLEEGDKAQNFDLFIGHTENVKLQVMHSTHCGYIRKADEKGESIFGKLIEDFILKK